MSRIPRRLPRLLTAFSGLLALLAVLATVVILQVQDSAEKNTVNQIHDQIQAKGLTPELSTFVSSVRKPYGHLATYVVQRPTGEVSGLLPVLAAEPRSLAGKTWNDAISYRPSVEGHLRTHTRAEDVTAPDGSSYRISVAVELTGLQMLILLTALSAAALAWLSLSLWVFRETEDRSDTARTGWLLLTLLTGPIGLGVWLVSRTNSSGPAPDAVCPSCGTANTQRKGFCVQCGHALRPVCPSCKHPVELTWRHCGDCGTDLSA